MGDLVTITTTGRATADVELKTSTNGKNTKYVQFGLAVNKGYGEHERPNFFSCVLYGEAAQRLTDAGVKKGSLITITGDLELETFKRNDGSEGWRAKVTLYDWRYAHTSKPKNTPQNTPESDASGFPVPMTVVRKDYRLVPNALDKSEELQS